jgi:hypothetical protein
MNNEDGLAAANLPPRSESDLQPFLTHNGTTRYCGNHLEVQQFSLPNLTEFVVLNDLCLAVQLFDLIQDTYKKRVHFHSTAMMICAKGWIDFDGEIAVMVGYVLRYPVTVLVWVCLVQICFCFRKLDRYCCMKLLHIHTNTEH